ncbi:hypothetical protein BC829DRAFT_432199 [Chytridium lagenaria]|nr:hypothetical protein BC829DRAFT_432199 [Chytridium lagenaria]
MGLSSNPSASHMRIDDECDDILPKPDASFVGPAVPIHRALQTSLEHWAAFVSKDKVIFASVRNYEFLIGQSAACHLVILKPQVDKIHCRVYVGEDDRIYLECLAKAGVYRNGAMVKQGQAVRLTDRDKIGLGKASNLELIVYLRPITANDPPAYEALRSQAMKATSTGKAMTEMEDILTCAICCDRLTHPCLLFPACILFAKLALIGS